MAKNRTMAQKHLKARKEASKIAKLHGYEVCESGILNTPEVNKDFRRCYKSEEEQARMFCTKHGWILCEVFSKKYFTYKIFDGGTKYSYPLEYINI